MAAAEGTLCLAHSAASVDRRLPIARRADAREYELHRVDRCRELVRFLHPTPTLILANLPSASME